MYVERGRLGSEPAFLVSQAPALPQGGKDDSTHVTAFTCDFFLNCVSSLVVFIKGYDNITDTVEHITNS